MSLGAGGGGGANSSLDAISKLTLKPPPKKKQRTFGLRPLNRILRQLQNMPMPSMPKPPDPVPPATEFMKDAISPVMERNNRGKRYGLKKAKRAGETGGYQAPGTKTTLG